MDNVEVKEVKSTTKIHHFTCDDCGADLGSYEEYEDGYYKEPKGFYIEHVKLKGHYCKECGMKRVNEVVDFARSKGFNIDDHVWG